jgi:rod shape-determining protein MreD
MKKTLFYFSTVLGALWGQIAVNHLVGGTWFSVDLVLIAVLFLGLTRGPVVAQSFAFVCGLLTDAASLGVMGVHTLLYTVAGYLSGMLSRQLDASKVWTQGLFTLGVSCLYFALYFGLQRIVGNVSGTANWAFLAHPFVNALVAPLVFILLEHWSDAWGLYPMER